MKRTSGTPRLPRRRVVRCFAAGARLAVHAPGKGAEVAAAIVVRVRIRAPAEAVSRAARAGEGDVV
eukprot:10226380-Lingulodinium_polyedra.AAC.1